MGKKDILFLIALLFALIVGFVVSLTYPYRVRFFPLIVICLCGTLVLAELLKASINKFKARGVESDRDNSQDEEVAESDKKQGLKFIFVIIWIGVFGLTMWVFGFVVGLPLFMLLYIKMQGERWLWAMIMPASMFVIVYVGFVLLLKRPLYEGLLFLG